MSEKEKQTGQSMKEAIPLLPENKLEFLLGYAEGVIAASKRQEEAEKSSA